MKPWKWPLVGLALAFGSPWVHRAMTQNLRAAIPDIDVWGSAHVGAIFISLGVMFLVFMLRGLE